MGEKQAIVLDLKDNVATAIMDIQEGTELKIGKGRIKILEKILFGHKFGLRPIRAGDYVIKYGAIIGRAKSNIAVGAHVHRDNVDDIAEELRRELRK